VTSVTALLDVNVLLALAWPNHIHHDSAIEWFVDNQMHGWATCPITENGFVRVSSNSRFTPEAKTPPEAMLQLERMTDLEGHEFWPDEFSLVETGRVERTQLQSHARVTDAYLLALAIDRSGRLATFDRGIASLVPPNYEGVPLILMGATNRKE
jgi:hypothetical protein